MPSSKPTVSLRCPANAYTGPGERIVEFSFPDGSGGLISFRSIGPQATPTVELYRLDPAIKVAVPTGHEE